MFMMDGPDSKLCDVVCVCVGGVFFAWRHALSCNASTTIGNYPQIDNNWGVSTIKTWVAMIALLILTDYIAASVK